MSGRNLVPSSYKRSDIGHEIRDASVEKIKRSLDSSVGCSRCNFVENHFIDTSLAFLGHIRQLADARFGRKKIGTTFC